MRVDDVLRVAAPGYNLQTCQRSEEYQRRKGESLHEWRKSDPQASQQVLDAAPSSFASRKSCRTGAMVNDRQQLLHPCGTKLGKTNGQSTRAERSDPPIIRLI